MSAGRRVRPGAKRDEELDSVVVAGDRRRAQRERADAELAARGDRTPQRQLGETGAGGVGRHARRHGDPRLLRDDRAAIERGWMGSLSRTPEP